MVLESEEDLKGNFLTGAESTSVGSQDGHPVGYIQLTGVGILN